MTKRKRGGGRSNTNKKGAGNEKHKGATPNQENEEEKRKEIQG